MTGHTRSADFPTTAGAFDRSINGLGDVFIVKLNAAGTALTYSTLLGGSDDEGGSGIAIDSAGHAYVVGTTRSLNFPTTPDAFDPTFNGAGANPVAHEAFVTKLNASGAALVYSTFLGGADTENGNGIAIDASGQAYVTGQTFSTDFPTTPGAYDTSDNPNEDVFVAKLDAAGATLVYSTLLGGSANDYGQAIAIDSVGTAYVTGVAQGNDFPTTVGAYDTTGGGGFVTKLDPAGATLVYSTFLGNGSPRDIALDDAGQAHVVGATQRGDGFPTTPGSFDTSHNGAIDVFVMKLNAGASALLYSTLLGGDHNDVAFGIALDQAGNAYIAGETKSSNYPTTAGSLDTTRDGSSDGVVTNLNVSGSALVHSTYLGGSLQIGGADFGFDVAVDESGSAYVTGRSEAPDFPTTLGAYDASTNGGNDVFVTKLDPSGAALVYSTFLGGSSHETASGIAVDDSGQAYVTGSSESADFPTTAAAYDTTGGGAFVTKLDPAGATLVYSTFLGSAVPEGIAVDASGQAFVTGYTSSIDFPTTAGAYNTSYNGGQQDGFVTKLNAAGSALVYSTFLGSISWESANAIAVDAVGNAYITGETVSASFPTTVGAYDTSFNGGAADAFVTKLDATGATLAYSTLLGGISADGGKSIAIDAGGNAYVSGVAGSPDFPTTEGAFDRTMGGGFDGFVAKLDASGSTLVYCTFLGGGSLEAGLDVGVDGSGNAYVTGYTVSSDFPVTPDALDPGWNYTRDAYVTKLNAAGTALLYSTYFGSIQDDEAYALALDGDGNVYVTGYTGSAKTFPTTAGAYDRSLDGAIDAFVSKFGDVGPPRPAVIVTANGSFGPLTLTSGNPLQVAVSFDLRGAAPFNPAEVYLGVRTRQGIFWWDAAAQRFVQTPTRIYAGPLSSFGPSAFVNLPDAGVLTPGTYLWFMAVDNDANGQPDNDFFDSVLTEIAFE